MDVKDQMIEQLFAQTKGLKEANDLLRIQVRSLQERIASLEKNSSNSSKPPSSDIVKPQKDVRKKPRKKRKPGGQPGHRKFSRTSFKPDETDYFVEYEFCARDAVGLQPLDEWQVVQQISLPEKLYYVTEHRARKYLDPKTGKIHIAPLPPEILQGGLLAADLCAMVGFLKGSCHMSYSTIQRYCKEVMGLDLSRGLLSKTVQKVSQSLEPAYDSLASRLPTETHLGSDETGHPDSGDGYWTWCFQTQGFTLFHIDKSRGSQVLFEFLGEDFKGYLNCDYFSAYRKFVRLSDAIVQYCMAHLIREIRFLTKQSSKHLNRWAEQLLDWLKKLFDTLHRHESMTPDGFARKMEGIKDGFLKRIRRPPNHNLAKTLAKRFKGKAAESYFRFLTDPDVEPTNNGTEREIRHAVIDRRITQGTRGVNGMRWCERIWTVIATCKKQNRNIFEFIQQSVLANWTNNSPPEFA